MLPGWTPDLRALDLLVSVAECGTVAKAAAQHHISQPSASVRLSRLERQLRVNVLIRSNKGTKLTPAGEAVASWARSVITSARDLTDGVASLRRDQMSRAHIAASMTIGEYMLPGWMLAMRREHPDIEIAATVANSSEVCDRVLNGSADVGFTESPAVRDELQAVALGCDRLCLLVSSSHPLAKRAAQSISVEELAEMPLLLREHGSGTRETFVKAVEQATGTTQDFPHSNEIGSTSTILATARGGGGVAVVSSLAAAADLATGQLVELRAERLDLQRTLNAVWLGREPSQYARELIGLARAMSFSGKRP